MPGLRRARIALSGALLLVACAFLIRFAGVSAAQLEAPLDLLYETPSYATVEMIEPLVTDDGLSGYGEVCPLGPFYLPAFGPGARAGVGELSATLLDEDPTALGPINQLMDRALLGHPYVKSAIDMACWDLLGKVTGKSVCDLMGGKFGDYLNPFTDGDDPRRFLNEEFFDKATDLMNLYERIFSSLNKIIVLWIITNCNCSICNVSINLCAKINFN